ncbi:MAG: hypothetical protein ACKVS6_03130 [Planctomycetota bacterium]
MTRQFFALLLVSSIAISIISFARGDAVRADTIDWKSDLADSRLLAAREGKPLWIVFRCEA